MQQNDTAKLSGRLTLKKLVDEFKFPVLSGEDKLAKTELNVYGLNRPGLELTGFFIKDDLNSNVNRRLVLMSSKESIYMAQFDEETRKAKYEALVKANIPAIAVTDKFQDLDTFLSVAKKYDFPVIKSNFKSTSDFTQKVLDYFDNYFAPQEEVHGSLVNIYGKGVLIMGKSGIGKSEMVLELMKSNHLFVGDDRIILTNKGSVIYGESHPILKDLIEVRGIGIMDISRTNGYQSIMAKTQLDLIVELFAFAEGQEDDTERLDANYATKPVLGVNIPYIRIPVTGGRNIASVVESAVSQLKLVQSGRNENVVELMDQRISKEQEEESANK